MAMNHTIPLLINSIKVICASGFNDDLKNEMAFERFVRVVWLARQQSSKMLMERFDMPLRYFNGFEFTVILHEVPRYLPEFTTNSRSLPDIIGHRVSAPATFSASNHSAYDRHTFGDLSFSIDCGPDLESFVEESIKFAYKYPDIIQEQAQNIFVEEGSGGEVIEVCKLGIMQGLGASKNVLERRNRKGLVSKFEKPLPPIPG